MVTRKGRKQCGRRRFLAGVAGTMVAAAVPPAAKAAAPSAAEVGRLKAQAVKQDLRITAHTPNPERAERFREHFALRVGCARGPVSQPFAVRLDHAAVAVLVPEAVSCDDFDRHSVRLASIALWDLDDGALYVTDPVERLTQTWQRRQSFGAAFVGEFLNAAEQPRTRSGLHFDTADEVFLQAMVDGAEVEVADCPTYLYRCQGQRSIVRMNRAEVGEWNQKLAAYRERQA